MRHALGVALLFVVGSAQAATLDDGLVISGTTLIDDNDSDLLTDNIYSATMYSTIGGSTTNGEATNTVLTDTGDGFGHTASLAGTNNTSVSGLAGDYSMEVTNNTADTYSFTFGITFTHLADADAGNLDARARSRLDVREVGVVTANAELYSRLTSESGFDYAADHSSWTDQIDDETSSTDLNSNGEVVSFGETRYFTIELLGGDNYDLEAEYFMDGRVFDIGASYDMTSSMYIFLDDFENLTNPLGDADGDGVPDSADICNGFDDNVDADGDGVPDGCDPCRYDADNDADGDGVCGDVDICLIGDDNLNTDGDALPDACDVCPIDPLNDADGDGFCADVDVCPLVYDDQSDSDGDGDGNACDVDDDNDGICDIAGTSGGLCVLGPDNCPIVNNPDQVDSDNDGAGDACDDDIDNDGVVDNVDQCPLTITGEIVNVTGCSITDQCACDADWKNHGGYVSCVANAAEVLELEGKLTGQEKGQTVRTAAQSSCGSDKGSPFTAVDADADGLPDSWEEANGLSSAVASDAAGDNDGDGLSNLGEYQHNTDPNDRDSDNDWLKDEFETGFFGTDPNSRDTDGDGIPDFWEGIHWTGPTVPNPGYDPDGDGYTNLEEYQNGTKPHTPDP